MRRKSKEKKTTYFDYTLLFLVVFLACFGLVVLYSASTTTAIKNNLPQDYYLKKQLLFSAIGAAAMLVFTLVDYKFWRPFYGIAYLVSTALCMLVLIPGIGKDSNGSTRWISIMGVQFQPSELAKISLILFFAVIFDRMRDRDFKGWRSFGFLMAALCVPMALVAKANLSTAIIIAGIFYIMLFVVDKNRMHVLALTLLGVLGAAGYIIFESYRADRIKAWLSIWRGENIDAEGLAYQTLQGLYAIGSGGIFGKGLGEGIQKAKVPEALNDMIFTIVCEEFGLFGGVCLLLLYLLIFWRMLIIANNARDRFGTLVVVGIMAHLAIQVILNVSVATNLLPNTGVTLPFLSYGGTSLIIIMCEIGIVLSVSRRIVLDSIGEGEKES